MAQRDGGTVTFDFQTVVVGAGVVGLATARALALAGHEVLVLEAEERIGQHTSSRNSGVIHAGLYYPRGSLRAQFCVQGRAMLYDYCASRHVSHERTGKLVVATAPDQLDLLARLVENARACGVDDLQVLTGEQAIALEPALKCNGATLSPSTGIVDVSALMLSLLGEAEGAGAVLSLGSTLQRVDPLADGFCLTIGETILTCANLVNSAGLGAWDLARNTDGFAADLIPQQHMAVGMWYSISGKSPFDRLIYPLSDGASLGVHYTRDTGGGYRFGPDLRYLDQQVVDYSLDDSQARVFEESVARWWPAVPKGQMQPDGCGIRPRMTGAGSALADFRIDGPADHGTKGLVHLFGIESPGLTSCLAIGAYVEKLLKGEIA